MMALRTLPGQPPPSSAVPGTLIGGKYRVERILGEGGMGVVLEATHVKLGKRMAVKLLRMEQRTPEAELRFEREAQIAAGLVSDHIAQVTDAGHTDAGEAFLVMELLVGNDLAAELRNQGRFPIAEAVDCVLQAAAGVACAHAAGLVHRDLKPANLFLAQRPLGDRIVKVLDFGLSKAQEREGEAALTATNSNFGTPQYMSPEQIQSSKHVDARSDQHALGMILFELLTGRPPYKGASITAVAVAIATQPIPRASMLCTDVPPALEEAISRSLAKDPDARYPDLRAFAEAIAPFGGERAREALARVHAALAPSGPLLREQPALSIADRDLLAVTSDPEGGASRRGPVLAGAAAALVFGVAIGVWLMGTRHAMPVPTPVTAPHDGTQGAAAPTNAVPSPPPVSSAAVHDEPAPRAEVTPVESGRPAVSAHPTMPTNDTTNTRRSTVAAPSSPSSAKRAASAPSHTSAPPKQSPRSARDVFGD